MIQSVGGSTDITKLISTQYYQAPGSKLAYCHYSNYPCLFGFETQATNGQDYNVKMDMCSGGLIHVPIDSKRFVLFFLCLLWLILI